MEELHSNKDTLDELTASVEEQRRNSAVLFSRNKPIHATVKRLSGLFSYSASLSRKDSGPRPGGQ